MSIIIWKPELSVGIKTIDDQHKKLVDMINKLHDAMSAGKGKDIMVKLVGELADYTDYHFKTEENLFNKYKYQELLSHKAEHDKLRSEVMTLKSKLDKGETIITVEVLYFLKDWLSKHILGSDKKYSSFLIGKGVN